MSWLVNSRAAASALSSRDDVQDVLSELRSRRIGGRGTTGSVPRAQANRLSSVWACLRLRADLVSTMPIDVIRESAGRKLEQRKPPVMVDPDGQGYGWEDWCYRSQYDLDGVGNTMGKIEEVDATGAPQVITLWNASEVSVGRKAGKLYWSHKGQRYDPEHVWHERQFPIAGSPLGLSPIAHAALAMQPALSAAQFAAVWFGGSATPAQHLRNTAKTLKKGEAKATKARFNADVEDGGIFVSGNDWELKVLSAKASESMFLEQMKFTPSDVCRFLGVPGDMIDAESSTGSITYANVTQRNLQLLIMHLNPALVRREKTFSLRMLPADRYAKFNRASLLQMDLKSRYEAYKVGIEGRFLDPNEARDHEDLAPLTPEQIALFKELFPSKNPNGPTPPGGPTP